MITVPRAKRPDATLNKTIHQNPNVGVASGRFARGTVIMAGGTARIKISVAILTRNC